MGKALDVVNAYYDATNNKKDAGAAAMLMDKRFVFVGPLMRLEGVAANVELLKNLLPAHKETRMLRQIADGSDVCSLYEMDVMTPVGATLTLAIADWMKVRNGKIVAQTIYYDPREFAKAFGM